MFGKDNPRAFQSLCWVLLLSVSIVTEGVKGSGQELRGRHCLYKQKSLCYSGPKEGWRRALKEVPIPLHTLWKDEQDTLSTTPNTYSLCRERPSVTLHLGLARHWILVQSFNPMVEAQRIESPFQGHKDGHWVCMGSRPNKLPEYSSSLLLDYIARCCLKNLKTTSQ